MSKQDKMIKLLTPQNFTKEQVEDMAKAGQVGKLENVVLHGMGELVKNISKVWNEEVRNFNKKLPSLIVSMIKVYIKFIKFNITETDK